MILNRNLELVLTKWLHGSEQIARI